MSSQSSEMGWNVAGLCPYAPHSDSYNYTCEDTAKKDTAIFELVLVRRQVQVSTCTDSSMCPTFRRKMTPDLPRRQGAYDKRW